jgi:hypothetical protein
LENPGNRPLSLPGAQDVIVGRDVNSIQFVQQLGMLRKNRLGKRTPLLGRMGRWPLTGLLQEIV